MSGYVWFQPAGCTRGASSPFYVSLSPGLRVQFALHVLRSSFDTGNWRYFTHNVLCLCRLFFSFWLVGRQLGRCWQNILCLRHWPEASLKIINNAFNYLKLLPLKQTYPYLKTVPLRRLPISGPICEPAPLFASQVVNSIHSFGESIIIMLAVLVIILSTKMGIFCCWFWGGKVNLAAAFH